MIGQISVGPRVYDEANPDAISDRASRRDPGHLLAKREEWFDSGAMGVVFKIYSNCSGLDDGLSAVGHIGGRNPYPASISAVTGTPTEFTIRRTSRNMDSRSIRWPSRIPRE